MNRLLYQPACWNARKDAVTGLAGHSGPQKEGDRAVVDQADHHMGTETPGFHPRRVFFAAGSQQLVEHRFSLQAMVGAYQALYDRQLAAVHYDKRNA